MSSSRKAILPFAPAKLPTTAARANALPELQKRGLRMATSGPVNVLLYMSVTGGTVAGVRYFKAMYRRNPPWFRQMLVEATIFIGTMGALVVLDWKKFLLYVLIPHQYAAWGIITMNLLQHDGCDENTEYDHSRNFVGRLFNWFTLNNGYHTIHHEIPGKHWSLLPELHAERIAPHIHPALDQPSLFGYVFRTTIYPGKRLRYDGTPLVVTGEGPDREWIKPTDVVPGF